MPLKIVRNDITQMHTEAIVNTANAHPTVGTGCDYAVHMAAGMELLLKYRKDKIGFVPEGEAFLTPGFRLQAKYIIHAVSPLYTNGSRGEERKLRSCYRKSLQIAKAHNVESIAFPLISTGGFGYPKEEGMRIAVDEIHAFLLKNEMEIYLVVFDAKATSLGEKIYPGLEAYIDQNYVENKRAEEYPSACFRAARSVGTEREGHFPGARPRDDRNLLGERPGDDRCLSDTRSTDDAYSTGARLTEEHTKGKFRKNIPGPDAAAKAMPAIHAPSVVRDAYEDAAYLYLDFEEQHEGKLRERMKHISDTFSEYLMYLIKEKDMTNAEVYKRAIVDKKIFSKIKNNAAYHPQKLTALCLCVGAKLNLDESKDLLARAGYALSPCDKTDIIFSYFIENEIYDMIELDIQLEEHGLPCIIS